MVSSFHKVGNLVAAPGFRPGRKDGLAKDSKSSASSSFATPVIAPRNLGGFFFMSVEKILLDRFQICVIVSI